MNKADIVALVDRGVLLITNHTLTPTHAYKVFKFRKELSRLYEGIRENIVALLKEAGIEDAIAFDVRLSELRAIETPSEKQAKELEQMERMYNQFVGMRGQLLSEEVTIDCRAMPYEEWFRLQNENREVSLGDRSVDVLSGRVEDVLEGILWEVPEE